MTVEKKNMPSSLTLVQNELASYIILRFCDMRLQSVIIINLKVHYKCLVKMLISATENKERCVTNYVNYPKDSPIVSWTLPLL